MSQMTPERSWGGCSHHLHFSDEDPSRRGLNNLPQLLYLLSGRVGLELSPSESRVLLFVTTVCCFRYTPYFIIPNCLPVCRVYLSCITPENYTGPNSTKHIYIFFAFCSGNFLFSDAFWFHLARMMCTSKRISHGCPTLHQETSQSLGPQEQAQCRPKLPQAGSPVQLRMGVCLRASHNGKHHKLAFRTP